MDIDEALGRYFANEHVAAWLLDDSPVREVSAEALRRSCVYSVAFGANAAGDGPHSLDIEDMLIVCGTPGHFVVGVIFGLAQPHVFAQTPLLKGLTPLVRRFAIDLSSRGCFEFMEFDLFSDGKTVVFLRHFLHTADYSLPVVATSRLYASRGPGALLGREIMRAALCEKANCPGCSLPAGTCRCGARIAPPPGAEVAAREPLALTTHSWTQYAASFIRKARRGWTRFALSAHIPHVGSTMLQEAFFPSITVVSFGDSPYMRVLQRRAVHDLGVAVVAPRADARIAPAAAASDYLAMHSQYIMRKRPRAASPCFTVHSSRAPSPLRVADAPSAREADAWDWLPRAGVLATSNEPAGDVGGGDGEVEYGRFLPEMSPLRPPPLVLEDPLDGPGAEYTASFESTGGASSHDTRETTLTAGTTVSLDDVAAIDLAVEGLDAGLSEITRALPVTAGYAQATSPVAADPPVAIDPPSKLPSMSAVSGWLPAFPAREGDVDVGPAPEILSAMAAIPAVRGVAPAAASSAAVPPRGPTAKSGGIEATWPLTSAAAAVPAAPAAPAAPVARVGASSSGAGARKRSAKRAKRGSATSDEERKHGCPRCASRFKMRGDLQRHIRTVHEGRKQHECATCGRTFGHSGHLNRHIESMHLNVRKHECKLCGDRFYQASHLQSHISHVHDRRKPFECPLCSLRLATESGLRNHLRNLHHAEDTYSCPVPACPEKFVLPSDRDRHVARKHPRAGSRSDSNVPAGRRE